MHLLNTYNCKKQLSDALGVFPERCPVFLSLEYSPSYKCSILECGVNYGGLLISAIWNM